MLLQANERNQMIIQFQAPNYENKRPEVCLKLGFETNFFKIELFSHKEYIFPAKIKDWILMSSKFFRFLVL